MALFNRIRTWLLVHNGQYIATTLFFGLLLIGGLLLHRDYGVSADEPNNHLNGLVSAKYIVQLLNPALADRQDSQHQIPDIHQFVDADHGVAFELPLAALSYVFTHHDPQAFYWMRHLLTFCIFVVGVWAFYRLGSRQFGHWAWGLLAAALLVLSPRLFAEAFYNSKDVIYMALFTVAMYTLMRLLTRPTPARVLLHALATAVAIDLRVQGLLLVVLTLGMLGWELAGQPAPAARLRTVRLGLLYLAATLLGTYVGWPYLWALSWSELSAVAGQRLNHFPWDGTVLYWGHVYHLPNERLPWHYIPGWILVTTPVAYSLAAIGGLLGAGWQLLRPRPATAARRWNTLVLVWLLLPLGLQMALHMTVYNGWRHLYFVYPAFLLLAVQGIRALALRIRHLGPAGRLAARAVLVAGAAEAGYTAVRMAEAHPNQHVYFSFLPPAAAERLFELDYWGLTYRQGLEWVFAHDNSPSISIAGNGGYMGNNLLLLPHLRPRVRYVPGAGPGRLPAEAQYYLTAYHYYGGRPQPFPDSVHLGREVYTIRANGLRIFSVFKRW